MTTRKKRDGLDSQLESLLARELDEPVGEALAEKIAEQYKSVTADMTRKQAIACVITEKAMDGDLSAAKYVYETARKTEERQAQEPFCVEIEVVDHEI